MVSWLAFRQDGDPRHVDPPRRVEQHDLWDGRRAKGDTGLTDEGKRQVSLLGERLAISGCDPAAVLTSPLPRAIETAAPIANVLRVQMHRHDGLAYRWPAASDGLS
jgi:broad specificity phosphatase PhoE